MKISLVYPRVLNLTFPPLGILYIAAVLKNDGHEVMVSIIDDKNKKIMVDRIKKFEPLVVGISIISTTQFNFVQSIIKELRLILPYAYFICGGTNATVFAKFILENFNIDIVVKGEGEATVRELISNIEDNTEISGIKGIVYKRNGEIVENLPQEPIYNLDEVPFPAREMIDFERYLMPPGVLRGIWMDRSTTIVASRGCPAHCIYCGSHLIFGRISRRRSTDNVISEIKYLIDRYNIDGIWFSDDTFTLDKAWVIDFAKKLKKEQIKIKWGCQARVNTVDYEMFNEIKQTGCLQVDFGVESGSPRVLKALKKGTSPEMVVRAFDLTKRVGMRTLATFMVGNPAEKQEDIEMTRKLSQRINADFTIFYFTTPYPGTELFDMAIKNNWLKNTDYTRWFVREASALEINFTQKELIKIRSRLQNRFIIRNIISSIRDYASLKKIIYFSLLNLPAFWGALKIMIKTKNFDDFIFNFIEKANKGKLKNGVKT